MGVKYEFIVTREGHSKSTLADEISSEQNHPGRRQGRDRTRAAMIFVYTRIVRCNGAGIANVPLYTHYDSEAQVGVSCEISGIQPPIPGLGLSIPDVWSCRLEQLQVFAACQVS